MNQMSSMTIVEKMALRGRLLPHILLNKMVLLKENKGTLLKLLALSCYLLQFLVCIGVKLFLLL